MIGDSVGNFKIISRIGRGGMGEVFLAQQQSVETMVAIKLLLADISEDRDHVERLFNEARVVGRIHHAGIAKIFDVGFHANGRAYLVMEYLDGESLATRIRKLGRLPIEKLADVGAQIASVLAATHLAGVIHRDLKPDNIYLTLDRGLASLERVKVLDFGIAKLSVLAPATPRTTGTLGTPAYMAPEQWGDAAAVDARADIYSLGCVAFEMACGRPPFVASSIAEACQKCLTEPAPSARAIAEDVPAELDELIGRMLAKDRADRPEIGEIERAFSALAGRPAMPRAAWTRPIVDVHGETVSAASGETAGTLSAAGAVTAPRASRPRWIPAAAIAGAAMIGAGVFLATRGSRVVVPPPVDARPADARAVMPADASVDAPPPDAPPPPPDADVTLSKRAITVVMPTVNTGTVDPAAIQKALARKAGNFGACLDRTVGVRDDRSGFLVINLDLHPTGRLHAGSVDYTVFRMTDHEGEVFTNCVGKVIGSIRSPELAVEADATVNIEFR